MKKGLSFSQLTALSLVLLPAQHTLGSAPKEALKSTTAPLTTSQSTSWFSGIFSSSSSEKQNPSQQNLSQKVHAGVEALRAMRTAHHKEISALILQRTKEYQEKFAQVSTQAEQLTQTPTEYIPALVTQSTDVLMDIRNREDAHARDLIRQSLAIVNQTRQERGRATAAQRNAGQTQRYLRDQSPDESLHNFATRITVQSETMTEQSSETTEQTSIKHRIMNDTDWTKVTAQKY